MCGHGETRKISDSSDSEPHEPSQPSENCEHLKIVAYANKIALVEAKNSVPEDWKIKYCDLVLMRVSVKKSQDEPSIGHGDLAQVFSSGGLAQV